MTDGRYHNGKNSYQNSGEDGPLPWYWLGVRWYDPSIRRFLQPDPSALDGVRSYVYAHDDPVDLLIRAGCAG